MLTLNNFIAILIALSTLFILFNKKIRCTKLWHATVTPLASIIGSGFLVSAPLLFLTTGHWAWLAMILIVLLAYGLGSSLRFNILNVEPILQHPTTSPWITHIEVVSRPILGIAYIISVAFYLKLLSAFALRGIGVSNLIYENTLTTLILLFIGILGKRRGLSMLELLEVYSVNTKLAIIGAIIVTFFIYNMTLILKGSWVLELHPHESWWPALRKMFGTLIIIQGFETSRYLSYGYSSKIRVKTMRYAQILSGFIYILFVALAMVVFRNIHQVTETMIIDLCRVIAPVLPILLIIAAVMSQFSAAVADTVGSGGLLFEGSHHRITVKNSYLLMTLISITLTWLTNIYSIITIASKAFAIYYALEIMQTLIFLHYNKHLKHRIASFTLYLFLLSIMILVIIFGMPVK